MKLSLSGAVLAAALLPATVSAQNLLTNPSFESNLSGWNAFGNANAVAAQTGFVPRTGNVLAQLFGNFSGGFDVTGIFQSFPASPGDTFTMDCWSRHWSGDALIGPGAPNANWCVMKIAFFDGAGTEIAGVETTILDGTSPLDVWIDNPAITGTAPTNTASVQALVLFLQPANDGGSLHVDDVEFSRVGGGTTYPGTGEDLVLTTAVGGGQPTTIDVKQATQGDLLQINVASPQGFYARSPYFLVGQVFRTGAPPRPTIRNFWFDLNAPIGTLVGNGNGPFGSALIAPGAGSSSFFVVPAGLGTMSVMLQGIVLDTRAANGRWSLTDAHELRIQ